MFFLSTKPLGHLDFFGEGKNSFENNLKWSFFLLKILTLEMCCDARHQEKLFDKLGGAEGVKKEKKVFLSPLSFLA